MVILGDSSINKHPSIRLQYDVRHDYHAFGDSLGLKLAMANGTGVRYGLTMTPQAKVIISGTTNVDSFAYLTINPSNVTPTGTFAVASTTGTMADVVAPSGVRNDIRLWASSTTNGFGSLIFGYRTRGDYTTRGAVQNGDVMLQLWGAGDDGTRYRLSPSLSFYATETWGFISRLWLGIGKYTKWQYNRFQ